MRSGPSLEVWPNVDSYFTKWDTVPVKVEM